MTFNKMCYGSVCFILVFAMVLRLVSCVFPLVHVCLPLSASIVSSVIPLRYLTCCSTSPVPRLVISVCVFSLCLPACLCEFVASVGVMGFLSSLCLQSPSGMCGFCFVLFFFFFFCFLFFFGFFFFFFLCLGGGGVWGGLISVLSNVSFAHWFLFALCLAVLLLFQFLVLELIFIHGSWFLFAFSFSLNKACFLFSLILPLVLILHLGPSQATFTHSQVFTERNIYPPPFSVITLCTEHHFQKRCHLHQPCIIIMPNLWAATNNTGDFLFVSKQ